VSKACLKLHSISRQELDPTLPKRSFDRSLNFQACSQPSKRRSAEAPKYLGLSPRTLDMRTADGISS